MKKVTFLGLLVLIVFASAIVAGCGLQGPALSTSNIVDAVKAKNDKTLVASCTQSTKDYMNSGFTKEIYGKNLPLDYLATLVGTKNLSDAEIETLEEKGNYAITKVTVKDKTAYLFFQKEKGKWLFDMSKTVTLSEANPKDKTISGIEKTEVAFTKNDYPTTVGLETRYFASKEAATEQATVPPVQVSFNLEGPWDFSQGPTDSEMVMTIVDKNKSPDMASFPNTNLVERYDFGQLYDDSFRLNDQNGLSSAGEVNHFLISKVPATFTYTPPWLELKYPAKKGLTWQDTFQDLETGFGGDAPYQVIHTSKVISVNQVKTPFKSYDKCFLVQRRVEEQKLGGTEVTYAYRWYVPNVGQVAQIKSVVGETNEVFTQAQRFWRLKFQGQEKPAGTPQN